MSQRRLNDLKNISPDELKNRQPWDQLIDESNKAYNGFLIYRNIPAPERTYESAWRIYNPPKAAQGATSSFKHWALRFKWEERAMAWDRHFNRIKDRATEKTFQKEMLEERSNRQEILNAMHAILAQYFLWVNNTEKSPTKLRALATAASTYMEQSRREYGDDPLLERQRDEELQENMENVRAKINAVLSEIPPDRREEPDSQFIQ